MPALSGVLGLSNPIVLPGQIGNVMTMNLTNLSSSIATISAVQPFIAGVANTPVYFGTPVCTQQPNGPIIVPNGGSVQFTFGVSAFGTCNRYTGGGNGVGQTNNTDTNPADVQSATYTIGVNVQTSDGVVSQPPTIQLQTVYSPNNLPVGAPGQLVFNNQLESALTSLI